MQKVGRSIHTEIKQQHLKYFLDTHLKVSKAIMSKNPWFSKTFFYADVFAGDGGEENDSGSPVIFEEVNSEINLPCSPIFIDENPVSVSRLQKKISSPVLTDKNDNILPKISLKKNQLGVLYIDPNGDPPLKKGEFIQSFYQKQNTQRIDLLIYFSGTTIKRALKAPTAKRDTTLVDNLTNLPKKHWLIRTPVGKHQWSFLLGTNWPDFPGFKKIDFHKVSSVTGQYILKKINLTAKELSLLEIAKPERQMTLF